MRSKVAFEIVCITVASQLFWEREFHSLEAATANALSPWVFFMIPFGMQIKSDKVYTVEPRLSGPRLSGFLDYPDSFSGPNFEYLLVTIKIRSHILFKTTALLDFALHLYLYFRLSGRFCSDNELKLILKMSKFHYHSSTFPRTSIELNNFHHKMSFIAG